MSASTAQPAPGSREPVSLGAIFRLFLTCGGVSFGGGVVGYLRDYLVERAKWLDDDQFLAAWELADTIPGLIALNVAVIVGDNLRGLRGAVVAIAGIMLPGTVLMLTLGALWDQIRTHHNVTTYLLGVAAAAVGMLAAEYGQMGRKSLSRLPDAPIVLATFLAVGILRFPTVAVLATLVPLSVWLYRPKPHRMQRHLGEHLPFHRGPRYGFLRHH